MLLWQYYFVNVVLPMLDRVRVRVRVGVRVRVRVRIYVVNVGLPMMV